MLRDFQRAFRRDLLGDGDGDLAAFTGMAPDQAARRMRIYRNNVQGSLAGVLASAFPVVERLVGKAFFRAAARAFVERHPPTVPQLSVYGADLPGFLAGFPPARTLPYLADVARLEWARIEAYFAGDAAPLDPAGLSSIDPADAAGLTFRLHPAVRLVASPFPVQRIWQANQPDHGTVSKVDLQAGVERVLVFRPAMTVLAHVLSAGDFALVQGIAAGATLGSAAAAAIEAEPGFSLQQALADHFSRAIFTDAA
ncbi:MAG: putative DNA-binding domain-containing protein [Rhodospirillaceae bacterium]|nr:putative DNA-binding domain-containing protein [Rhodospirillaceae bacterium]